MPGHDIIVIGASMGGVEALRVLLPGLGRDTQAAIFVVWHMAPSSLGLLPDLLHDVSPLPIANARDGESIQPGQIYVAAPNRHLLVEQGRVRLTHGPKENRFRPAVDPLFRSAAVAFGPRVVGVVLSGALDDGTAGLRAIKDRGGVAVVQDPLDAVHPSMPRSAMRYVEVDHVVPARVLGTLLHDLAQTPVEEGGSPVSDKLNIETRIAMEDNAREAGVTELGQPSLFTCPECHGTLLQLSDDNMLRFRCHTGHAFSTQSLLAETAEAIEDSLWNAIRAIEERVMLLSHVAGHLRESGDVQGEDQFLAQSRAAEQQAQIVRLAVLRRSTANAAGTEATPEGGKR